MLERVTGPFNGYYVVAYACEMGELGQEFLGHFKICRAPAPYLDAVHLVAGTSEMVSMTAEAALFRAELLAKMRIVNMPPLETLAARHVQRRAVADTSLPPNL